MTLTGRNKKKTLKVSKLTSCMNFRMIQAVIKCFERSAVETIEENSNVASPWASTLLVSLYFVSYQIRSPRLIPSLHFIPCLQVHVLDLVRFLHLVCLLYPVCSPRFILTASLIVTSGELIGCKIRDMRSHIISVSFKLSI